MTGGDLWIQEKAGASTHPAQVETTLTQLRDAWPATAPPLVKVVEQFPLGEAALLHLLAISSICATRLARDPKLLLWLHQPDVCLAQRGYAQMSNDLSGLAGDLIAERNFRAVRLWKGREMVRIALRELADVAPLEETTSELSYLAEICIRRVFEHWDADLRRRHGSPTAEFGILALGKLGGYELNHSSDVDLIFLYSEDGQLSPRLSYHEFFNRLAEKILESFSAPDPEGSLFRVDLRLRPEGSAGPLARSLESMEHYYGGFGETWERLALIRARGIAGSRELAYEFLRQHQPFIYPKSPTPDLLEEIANLKRRIERDVVGHDKLGRDVKLGRGGIREIEFVVQTLQFMHGARHAFLQHPGTLKALQGLAQLELVPRTELADLDRAYRFLRRTEHRLQIEAEQQTHTVPASSENLRRLAQSLGFDSSDKFTTALEREMLAVRSVFQRIIVDAPRGKEIAPIDFEVFANQPQAERALAELTQGPSGTHVAPRTRQVFRKLRPLLLGQLAKTADPDSALTQFVRFVEAYGLRSALFELLVTNPKLLELIIKIFDASRFAGDLLMHHPRVLEEITRAEKLDRPHDKVHHLRQLRALGKKEKSLDKLRAYRQAELLRILVRDVLGLSDLAAICQEHSSLAEACLVFVNQLLGGEDLTIIAMGKFGGEEISYGADLDVLFVGDESRAAEKLLSVIAQPSAAGNLSRLDARLRPEGEKGPLVCSIEMYRRYYGGRAQIWELQALTRARPIAGPLQNEFMTVARNAWHETGQHVDLYARIDSMLERIRRERGSGSEFLDFKTGRGGIIEAEFLVQALQMRKGIWEPRWQNAVDRLHDCGQLTDSEVVNLKRAYVFLRRCESILRRHENNAVSALPSETVEQTKLARRLGFKTIEGFTQEYHAARTAIHDVYNRPVGRMSTKGD